MIQIFDFSALEAAWQAADKATALYETLPDPLLDRLNLAATSKYATAYADLTAGIDKLTAAARASAADASMYGAAYASAIHAVDKLGVLRSAADIPKFAAACASAIQALDKLGVLRLAAEISKCVAYADPTPGLDKLTATALGSAARDALAFVPREATVHSAIRDLVRRDEAWAPFKQGLGTIRTPPDTDHLLAEGYTQPIFAPANSAVTVGDSRARDEMPAGPQTGARAWIAWERRYNTELLLLASLILIVLALLQWLDPQTAPAPSQPDPSITSLHRGSSQQPVLKEPQSENCSPTSGSADGPVPLLPAYDKDPWLTRG